MSVKRTTSAETAQRFLDRYKPSPRVRKYRKVRKLHPCRCVNCNGDQCETCFECRLTHQGASR